jgi:tetratricopeptide (TPR) repeat protein
MRSFNIKTVFLIAAVGLSTFALSSMPTPGENIFRKHSVSASDTAELNRHIREAMVYVVKSRNQMDPRDINLLKASIDTAELICVEKKIEFPSSLHLARAEYFFIISDIRSASQEATLALNKSRSNGEMRVLARTNNFLGRYSLRTHFFMESISYFEECISIAKKNKIRGIIPRTYYALSAVYDTSALHNLSEYRNTLVKMINTARDENDTLALMVGYWSLGTSLTDREPDYNKADSILRICLDISLTKKDTLFITRSLLNIGWNYYNQKKYNSSIEYYNRSLNYSIPARIYESSDNAYGNLGTIYRDLNNGEKAILYYGKALEQANLGNDLYARWWINRDMSEMYLRQGDTANAYKSLVLFKKFNDIFILKNNNQGLSDARIRYEADSHNKEVELLSLKLYNQRLIIYGSAGFFVLSITVLILLLSRARINAKRRMSEMNRKISEITQANLRQQMNPHFIFNTLNSIQYYMYQHDKLATNNYLTKFSSLMRKVLENSQHTSVPLSDELDALNLYLELEMVRFKDKFEYEINVDEEIDTLLYKVPTMLIQPYVENSICHGLMPGETKGFIRIDLKLENECILCTIEDNGIGREAAQARKIKSDDNHNSLGTQIVSSRLDLVNALYGTSLKTVYTDLKDENGEPSGTRVEIQIPILS